MHTHSKHTLTAIAAAIIMAAAVGTSSAGHISVSHGRLANLLWFDAIFNIAGVDAAGCPVTLEASFHNATFPKRIGTLVGYVTRAALGTCTRGSATVLTETLPWHIQYGGFNGALSFFKPILNLIGASFRIRNIFTCLTRSSTTEPMRGIVEPTYEAAGKGTIERFTAESNARIECPGVGRGGIEGAASVTESPGGLRNVLIRLI